MDIFYAIILGIGLVFGGLNVYQMAKGIGHPAVSVVGILGSIVAIAVSVLHFIN